MRKLPSSASAGNLRQLVTLSSNDTSPTTLQSPHHPSPNISPSVSSDARSSKKSLAYLHTKFHELGTDDFGKTFERRTCNYCSARFSFKGCTTSAALRHVKTAHPERIVSVIDEAAAKNTGNSIQVPVPPIEPIVDTVAASVDTTSINRTELRRENSVVSLVSSTASEDGYGGSSRKRKRENEVSEISGDTHSGTSSNVSKMSTSNVNFTASQEAIRHFLHHYANELPHPAMRLRFAKHLTYNVAEAEMYNVLDPATQQEYIREFAQS